MLKVITPPVAGLVATVGQAHAGPIATALNSVGLDMASGAVAIGTGLIIWAGIRIMLDEHHSVNAGRVVGALTGGLFIFGAPSIGAWTAGW